MATAVRKLSRLSMNVYKGRCFESDIVCELKKALTTQHIHKVKSHSQYHNFMPSKILFLKVLY